MQARRALHAVLLDFDTKNQIKVFLRYFYDSIVHIQESFKRLLIQREMNAGYAVARFKQELNRLKFFYLQKAGKNKTAAKVFSRLDDIDVQDEATLANIDDALADYRKI